MVLCLFHAVHSLRDVEDSTIGGRSNAVCDALDPSKRFAGVPRDQSAGVLVDDSELFSNKVATKNERRGKSSAFVLLFYRWVTGVLAASIPLLEDCSGSRRRWMMRSLTVPGVETCRRDDLATRGPGLRCSGSWELGIQAGGYHRGTRMRQSCLLRRTPLPRVKCHAKQC